MAADRLHEVQQHHPADQPGEQWHGWHADERELREPRPVPGGVQHMVETAAGGNRRP
jgi:hypothetical protein